MLQKIFLSIPLSRLFLYLGFLLLLPFLVLYFHFSSHLSTLDKINLHLEKTTHLFLKKEQSQAINKALSAHLAKRGGYALESELEKLLFLKKERVEIEKFLEKSKLIGNLSMEGRLRSLANNKIKFTESSPQIKMGLKESTLSSNSVEIDMHDLKDVFKILENSYPQYLVIDLRLNRNKKESGSEVYLLSCKLLKREFL